MGNCHCGDQLGRLSVYMDTQHCNCCGGSSSHSSHVGSSSYHRYFDIELAHVYVEECLQLIV